VKLRREKAAAGSAEAPEAEDKARPEISEDDLDVPAFMRRPLRPERK
jgi:hypothetical protein